MGLPTKICRAVIEDSEQISALMAQAYEPYFLRFGPGARKHMSLPALIAHQQSMGATHHD